LANTAARPGSFSLNFAMTAATSDSSAAGAGREAVTGASVMDAAAKQLTMERRTVVILRRAKDRVGDASELITRCPLPGGAGGTGRPRAARAPTRSVASARAR